MKFNMKRVAAMAMAATLCVPGAAFAAEAAPAINGETNGTLNTDFDIYSPSLHISVPLKADIKVNPLADSAAADDLQKFTVASNSVDIINASVDTENNIAIPVNVTVNASIASKKEDVAVSYFTLAENGTSTKKKINLNLTEAATAATLDEANKAALTGDKSKLIDLATVSVDDAAVYTGASNETPITANGSLLSMDIAAPTLDSGKSDFTVPADVHPAVGSFAVTGVANTNADWKKEDIAVNITYNVRASKALGITTPAVAAVSVAANNTADVTITIPDVGEATVMAAGAHSPEGLYPDHVWDAAAYTVDYAPNATTSTQTDATITLKAGDDALKLLAGDDFKGKAQDLVIALSDGRIVVSTLTVN